MYSFLTQGYQFHCHAKIKGYTLDFISIIHYRFLTGINLSQYSIENANKVKDEKEITFYVLYTSSLPFRF